MAEIPDPVQAEPTLRVLSLGAGVQSTTLLLMSAEGILPKLDYAIFADTQGEPAYVYEHLDRVTEAAAGGGIPVLRVSKGNLAADAISRFATLPYFILYADGSAGMGQRQCTHQYKLDEIRRKVRELLGAAPPAFRRVPKGRTCEQWVGFSTDEIGRISDGYQVSYQQIAYPLLDLGMDRKACERWLRSRGWTSVAKSACLFCPYHGNKQWRDMRDNHPAEWAAACAFDVAIRRGGGHELPAGATAYLHASRVPLAIAPIDKVTSAEWKSRQGDLLDVIADIEMAENGNPDGCSPYGCRSGSAIKVAGSSVQPGTASTAGEENGS